MERYMIVATLSGTTCEGCGDMDGLVFPMSEFKPGSTANPFHPNCRCTTKPYDEDVEKFAKRIARDPETGEQYKVPASMTFNEWKAKYVDKTGESGIISKKISDHVVEHYAESEVTYDLSVLDQEIQSSFIGRETEKYIEDHGLRVEIYYNFDSDGVAGEIQKNTISLYALYNNDEKELTSTLIHEVSHERFHWSGTQEAEVNCYIMELMHKNNGQVSTTEIQDIVSFVRENYSYLPEGDLYGF